MAKPPEKKPKVQVQKSALAAQKPATPAQAAPPQPPQTQQKPASQPQPQPETPASSR